jgi:hypothetical protein
VITKLTLRNFKGVGEQTYDFSGFDLLVGSNNSGKSTILQALAIWQFCVEEFKGSKRTGSTGTQIVLPNFTALPVPEFNLLWKNRIDRHWPVSVDGKKKQAYILIDIDVEWRKSDGELCSFGVQLRYHSPQTIYAIPIEGWSAFRDLVDGDDLPKIAYVPPFSGLEPSEKWMDVAPIRQQIGKGQPGSVLRNLLLKVSQSKPKQTEGGSTTDWDELADIVKSWFGVDLKKPNYDSDRDVFIAIDYKKEGKSFDIISGGSGFHQTLTLLAFFYGYKPTTILLDEPDAHLHVNLQRRILDYFLRKSKERNTQFLIATHAEELAKGVNPTQIVSLLSGKPKRIQSTPAILSAMALISNEDIIRLKASPFILYVEGESDERILRAWARACDAEAALQRFTFRTMGGGSKKDMKDFAEKHSKALQQIIPELKKTMLFDYDSDESAFHPPDDNPVLREWKRKNIENYLLVPDAWKRTLINELNRETSDLFTAPLEHIVDQFFSAENLTKPAGSSWRDVKATIFQIVDGKKLLFENKNALFHSLLTAEPILQLRREDIARNMTSDELHDDVHQFMQKIKDIVNNSKA